MSWRWSLAGAAAAAVVVVAAVFVVRRPAARPVSPTPAAAVTGPESAAAGLMQEYETYVRGMDEAIEECEAALSENPQNPRVRQAYLTVQSSRADAMDAFISGGE